MAVQYAPLFALEKQFQAKDGRNNTGGWLKVFLAGTDDPATTYSDYNFTRNPEKIVLDDDGRAVVICDKSKGYRLEVYDISGSLMWTEEPVFCSGTGGGGISITKVISTDGSISVDETVVGSTTTYDIGMAPGDSNEFLEWIKCSEEDCGSTWYPVYQSGTMETEAGYGIRVHKGNLYHFTSTFYVDPDGTGVNYDTFKVSMYLGDAIVDSRKFDIDSSLNDVVQCEFSTDVIPEEDGFVYFKLEIPSTCEVSGEVQAHRIYSGINAVPDTCATKQWVEQTFDMNLSSKVDYSAIEYNQDGDITGISGSAIAASHVDPTVFVPWSASGAFAPSGDYAYNSSLSSYIPASASSQFQPSGNYQSAGDYAFNSSVSSKLDASASGYFVLNSSMSAYVPFSGLEGDGMKITGISGSAIKGHEYTGINPVVVDNVNDTISVDHRTLCVDSTMTAYNSGNSAVIGVNVGSLNLSAKMDASASSEFYSTSNPSGFITGVDLSEYAKQSSVNLKADASALSSYQPTSAMSAYATESWASAEISAKLDVTATSQFITALPADLATTSDVASAVSSKMDKSESSAFYPMDSNPSGYLTAHQSLAGLATTGYVDSAVSGKLDSTAYDSAQFQLTASMSAYQLSGDYAFNSSLSAKMDVSASSEFYSTSNPSGFITGVDLSEYATTGYVDSAVSGKQDASAMTAYQPSGDYAYNSSLSAYQLTADMSAYQPSGDYAYNSSLADKQDASAMTAYQDIAGMTAYQPAGAYIYESAIGIGEI